MYPLLKTDDLNRYICKKTAQYDFYQFIFIFIFWTLCNGAKKDFLQYK